LFDSNGNVKGFSVVGDDMLLENEVTLSFDGNLYIDDVLVQQIDLETLAILKDAQVDFNKIKLLNNNNHTYPIFRGKKLHSIVGRVDADLNLKYWISKGFVLNLTILPPIFCASLCNSTKLLSITW
jgi:hypothetical protein